MPELTQPGTITKSRNKYFVAVRDRKMEIPVGLTVKEAELDKLAGKEVQVALSTARIPTVVGIRPPGKRPGCYWIVCYIPVPDIFKKIDDRIRRELVTAMVDQKIIAEEVGKEIQTGIKG